MSDSSNNQQLGTLNNPMPYSLTKKADPRDSLSCSMVSWDGVKPKMKTFVIEGEEFKVAEEPPLPQGYAMLEHPSWYALWERFMEARENQEYPEIQDWFRDKGWRVPEEDNFIDMTSRGAGIDPVEASFYDPNWFGVDIDEIEEEDEDF